MRESEVRESEVGARERTSVVINTHRSRLYMPGFVCGGTPTSTSPSSAAPLPTLVVVLTPTGSPTTSSGVSARSPASVC